MFPGPDSMGFVWDRVGALCSHFCYVGGFGDLGDPVVPTLRGVSGDVVTVYGLLGYNKTFLAVSRLADGRPNGRANDAKWLFPPIMA